MEIEYFQMRIDEETLQELDKIAEVTGIKNRSSTVRWLIRKEFKRLSPEVPQMEAITEPAIVE